MKKPTIPEVVEGRREWVEKHLNNYVETAAGCWEFQGYRNRRGYGVMGFARGHGSNSSHSYRPHRVSYCYHKHTDPASLVVRHTCDNPCCINPAHLRLGTYADNSRDAMERGRNARGETHGRSKLTDEDVLKIKKRLLGKKETYVEIAKDFNVSPRAISYINTGSYWSHIQLPEETLPCVRVCTEQLRLPFNFV